MNFGTIMGILFSLSFVCSMYAPRLAMLGIMSNLLAIAALFVCITALRSIRGKFTGISYLQVCRMTVSMFFFAILFTALIQYIYFAYLDHGQLAKQIETIIEMPEYRKLLQQMAGNSQDIDTMISSALEVIQNPTRATMQLMWMNLFVSLFATPFVALIAIIGKPAKNKTATQ